jgi:hypothetical protein
LSSFSQNRYIKSYPRVKAKKNAPAGGGHSEEMLDTEVLATTRIYLFRQHGIGGYHEKLSEGDIPNFPNIFLKFFDKIISGRCQSDLDQNTLKLRP